ncbi:MAG: hypothetical protein ACRDNA_10845, partial [Gaiellaceae bacterium]
MVGDLDKLDVGLDSKLRCEPLDERSRRLLVRAALEIEDLDARRSHPPGSSMRQQAATCSALSARSD